MRNTIILSTLLAGAVVLSTPGLSMAQPYRRDFANGMRDAAAKANFDPYYLYTRQAATREGPITSMLGGPGQVAAPVTARRSFSRASAPVMGQPTAAPTLSLATIRQNAGEIRTNLMTANQEYVNLSNQYKNNAEAEKRLKLEHGHRQAALAAIDKLQAQWQAGGNNSRAADADARTVQTELAAASSEHWRFTHSIQTPPAANTR